MPSSWYVKDNGIILNYTAFFGVDGHKIFHYNEYMFSRVKISSINNNFKNLLVKTAHQAILSFFLADPTGWFYGSQISKRTGISTGQTSKVLNDLLKYGLLEKEVKGKTELYRVIADNPVLSTYKTLNAIIAITPLISDLKKVSLRIILYGSCAKGINIKDSDLDLLVVTAKREEVLYAISRFSKNAYYGFSEIKPVFKRPAEWALLESNDPVFYNELQKGILLFERGIDESRL